MHQNVLIESDGGHTITAQYNIPSEEQCNKGAPLVIMPYCLQQTHEHIPNLFSKISENLKALGLCSLLYDYHEQHGTQGDLQESRSERLIADLNVLFLWAHKNNFKKLAFVTEGLGASLLFMTLPKNAVFTVLLWPVLNLEAFIKNQNAPHVSKERAIGHELIENVTENNLRYFLGNVHTPTMILYGMKDEIISSAHLLEARKYLMAPRLDITTFEDGRHGFPDTSHEKACVQQISDFVKKYA